MESSEHYKTDQNIVFKVLMMIGIIFATKSANAGIKIVVKLPPA